MHWVLLRSSEMLFFEAHRSKGTVLNRERPDVREYEDNHYHRKLPNVNFTGNNFGDALLSVPTAK